jgi:putative protease
MKRPELLMPAGDLEKMRWAFAFGADAVYLGIPRFSLRARENGFKDLSQVAEAVAYAHGLGRKVYVTANIFAHNSKVDAFVKYIGDLLALCKPDAWIISDPGMIMLMRENFPKEILHISVQANTINYAAVRFWQQLGAQRIILSREISISEMSDIHKRCPDIELESFVHGTVCMAYSGRCLISNYLTHRDSNQGVCTNSCRWQYKVFKKDSKTEDIPYEPIKEDIYLQEKTRPGEYLPMDEDEHGTYLMNAKDLCGVLCLKELYEAGVCSFKVEGRGKSLYYVAMIARAYRKAIDDVMAARPIGDAHLRDIWATSSHGFNEGFLHGHPDHKAQLYDQGSPVAGECRFSGIIRGYDTQKNYLIVEPRGLIKVGGTYDLCAPDKDCVLTVSVIINEKDQVCSEIHGGLRLCRIPYDQDPGPFALLREKMNGGTEQ